MKVLDRDELQIGMIVRFVGKTYINCTMKIMYLDRNCVTLEIIDNPESRYCIGELLIMSWNNKAWGLALLNQSNYKKPKISLTRSRT